MAKFCRSVPATSKPPSGGKEPADKPANMNPTATTTPADRVRDLFKEYHVNLSEDDLQKIFKIAQKTERDDDTMDNEN